MPTYTFPLGTRTALTTTAHNSLGNDTYVSAGNIAMAGAVNCLLEVKVTPGTVSSNKQVTIWGKRSLDGTNFESGPESGTSETDQANLVFLGSVPCNTNSTAQTRVIPLAARCGGMLPHTLKIILRNETGAALASSGNHVYYSLVNGNST